MNSKEKCQISCVSEFHATKKVPPWSVNADSGSSNTIEPIHSPYPNRLFARVFKYPGIRMLCLRCAPRPKQMQLG